MYVTAVWFEVASFGIVKKTGRMDEATLHQSLQPDAAEQEEVASEIRNPNRGQVFGASATAGSLHQSEAGKRRFV